MREHATATTGEVPEAPDFSEAMSAMVQSVWAAAWKRAVEQADEATGVALDAARAGEADALAAAERAEADKDEAVVARKDAVREVEQLRGDLDALRGQLAEARKDADDARVRAEDAGRGRVRAEAASDTLREVLDSLRNTGTETGDRP